MSTAKRSRAIVSPAAGRRKAPDGDLRIVEGRITEVRADGRARLVASFGRIIDCRCPQHINLDWLRAAVAVGPVTAEASVNASARGSLWSLFPGPEHRTVAPPELDLVARDAVRIACGEATVNLAKDGTVRVRGRDVTTRGSRVARLQGGTVRIN